MRLRRVRPQVRKVDFYELPYLDSAATLAAAERDLKDVLQRLEQVNGSEDQIERIHARALEARAYELVNEIEVLEEFRSETSLSSWLYWRTRPLRGSDSEKLARSVETQLSKHFGPVVCYLNSNAGSIGVQWLAVSTDEQAWGETRLDAAVALAEKLGAKVEI